MHVMIFAFSICADGRQGWGWERAKAEGCSRSRQCLGKRANRNKEGKLLILLGSNIEAGMQNCKTKGPRGEKHRHSLFVSLLQTLDETRIKQEEILATVGKEKKFVCFLNALNFLGKWKFTHISSFISSNIWPCTVLGLCRVYSVGEAHHINIYVVWWISGWGLSGSHEGWSGNTVWLSVFWATFRWKNCHLHMEESFAKLDIDVIWGIPK